MYHLIHHPDNSLHVLLSQLIANHTCQYAKTCTLFLVEIVLWKIVKLKVKDQFCLLLASVCVLLSLHAERWVLKVHTRWIEHFQSPTGICDLDLLYNQNLVLGKDWAPCGSHLSVAVGIRILKKEKYNL